MAIEVNVPDIGDFKDVPVIEIHVKPGDPIKADDPLVTLETDKATMEFEAVDEGVVAKILVAEGTDNVLLPMRDALAARATGGEVSKALREVWGMYVPREQF